MNSINKLSDYEKIKFELDELKNLKDDLINRRKPYKQRSTELSQQIEILNKQLSAANNDLAAIDVKIAEVTTHYQRLETFLSIINEKLLNVGDVFSHRGYLIPEEIEFFRMHGCRAQNFDFGVEEYEIKRISPRNVVDEDSKKLDLEKRK